MKKILTQLVFALLIPNLFFAQAFKSISPNDTLIHITGAKFSKISRDMIEFRRHSDSVLALPLYKSLFNPEKAKTTTGIVMAFKTESPKVIMHFRKLPGTQRAGSFGIYQNGKFTDKFFLKYNADSSITFTVDAIDSGETFFEITLPTWNNLAFTGMEIEESTELKIFEPEKKKIYVAYGNSITHGVGQYGTHETYAYKVARNFDWELYNVAVGGAKTSATIATMLRDDFSKIDYMTVLIGYNDYNGEGIDTAEYKERYASVLNIVREKHPETKIFCIAQTYTTQDTSVKTGIPIEDFRTVVANIVERRKSNGDKNIFLIKGDKLTDASNLKDAVHFTVDGAAAFADTLINVLKSILDSTATGVDAKEMGMNTEATKGKIEFVIYPNPANGYINVYANKPVKKITIYNIRGEAVKTFSNTSKLKIAGLSKGIYFLQYMDLKGSFTTQKFILN